MPSSRSLQCSPQRRQVLDRVAALVPAASGEDCVRVAVDGVDGSGKTVFADELAAALDTAGRPALRVSVDGFHQPREVRHRRGRRSPEGFWLDSFDYASLRADVLDPLSPGGSRRFRRAVRDVASDARLELPFEVAPPGVVLVLDGLFPHRDGLIGYWDLSIFLDAPFDVTVARLAARDGSDPDPEHPSVARYVQGQRLYFEACDPLRRAHLVIDNTVLDRPVLRPRG